MGDKPLNDGTGPSLELPQLFGRWKRTAPVVEPATEPEEPAVGPEEDARTDEGPAQKSSPATVAAAGEPMAAGPSEPTQLPPDRTHEQEGDDDGELRLPAVPGRVAAAITGVLVGLLGAVLTWASLEGCEQLRGTDSCGGEGFLLLLVILVLMVLVGGIMLAAWDVADPRSTSALGVGILCVVVLLLLIEELLDPWMFLVVPVVAGLGYVAAHWVTTALIEENDADRGSESHDIR